MSRKDKKGIYIHIPFCERRCSYCVFTTFAGNEEKIRKYVDKLLEEIDKYEEKEANILGSSSDVKQTIDTIFIGGGTPSYIDPKYIEIILNKVYSKFNVLPNAEITMESNPSSITENGLKTYVRAGINRLSMGLQSTNDEILKRAERLHTFAEFKEKYALAKKYYDNINLDIIMGLPLETKETFSKTLSDLVNLNPNHISMYELSVEENSKLYHSDEMMEELPKESKLYGMQKFGIEYLMSHGYKQYEISNFAKDGKYSKHNYNCWMQHEYIGFGISASSFIGKYRHTQTKKLDKYLSEGEKTFKIDEILDLNSYVQDYLFVKLRTIRGITFTSTFKRINKYVNDSYDSKSVNINNFKITFGDSNTNSKSKEITKAKLKALEFISLMNKEGMLNYSNVNSDILSTSDKLKEYTDNLTNLTKITSKKLSLNSKFTGKYNSRYAYKCNFDSMYGANNIFRKILSDY